MKKFLLLTLMIFFPLTSSTAQWITTETDSLIRQVTSETNLDTMNYYLRVLTGVDSVTIGGNRHLITTRHAWYPDNNVAAGFIYQTLNQTGLPVYNDNYTSSGRNVYAVQTGSDFPDEQFIICAHYDDMPQGPIAPGADDNASGVAAVLEAARVISKLQTKYTIIYALWDEEEVGLIGSGHYASQAQLSGENILGVINLDMIAYESDSVNALYLSTSSLGKSIDIARVGGAIANYFSPKLHPLLVPNGRGGSDHESFWEKGFSAIFIQERNDVFNPYYHTVNDNLSTLNLDYFFDMVRLSIGSMMFLNLHGLTDGNINSQISSLDRAYAKISEDSVRFRIAFPEFDPSQNIVAHLLCSSPLGPVIDSLTLFDDGLHGDSLSGDGIFGAYIPPRTTEDIFIPAVSTLDLSTNKYYCITQWVPFTTIGPVIFESSDITKLNQNKYTVTITVKNESAVETVMDADLKLKCLDSWADSVAQVRDLGNILPGESKIAYFSITTLDSLPHESFNMEIEILSYGYSFWKYLIDIIVGIDEGPFEPISFNLGQNYPNPFNPTTKISWQTPKGGLQTLIVYDVLGREVATLFNEYKRAGKYEVEFNAANLPSGVYFYRLQAGDFVDTKKMVLMK